MSSEHDAQHKHEQQHEQQLQGPSGKSAGLRAYLAHRAKPYLGPWVLAGGAGIAGAAASVPWHGQPLPAVLLTAGSGLGTWATWWASQRADAARRIHATVTVGAASAWLTACALAGPGVQPIPDLYVIGGGVLAASWNVRQVMRRNPELAAAGTGGDSAIKEAIGLAKAKLGKPQVEPNKVTIPYQLEPGQTHDDAVKALKPLASATDVPVNAVRHRGDAESAREGEFTIVPVDMLRDVIWYPGPSNLGGSIADPIVIGVYDDGQPLQLTIPQALHLLIMGVTGAGKTEGAIDVLAEVLTRRDVIVWLSDPKCGQDLGAAFGACDWVVTKAGGADLMTQALRHVIPARQEWLGRHAYRSWVEASALVQDGTGSCREDGEPCGHQHTCREDGTACACPGMPYMVAWFEEAASTLASVDDSMFTNIAQEARSAGVWLVISMQRASGYQISTDTRASLPAALCFGVDERDAGFALPGDVLDQGANPGFGNRRPGVCYLVANGVDPDRYVTPARTFRNDPVALEAARDRCSVLRMGVDQVTADAAARVAGRAYTERPKPVLGVISPEQAAIAATLPTAEQESADMPQDRIVIGTVGAGKTPVDAAELDSVEPVDPREDPTAAGRAWVDPEDADVDPTAELPASEPGDDEPIFGGNDGRKPSPEEGRRLFALALDEFEADGQMIVRPKDFLDWADDHNLSRSWVSLRLADAARRGRLAETGKAGQWRIVPVLETA